MFGFIILLGIMTFILWVEFKITGAIFRVPLWLFIKVTVGLCMLSIGLVMCVTILLIPIGKWLHREGIEMVIPG